MALALCVPIFWLPTLVLLTLAAVLSRKRGRGVVVRIVLFYGLFALFTSSVLGLLYAAAPNPSNRDAGFAGIFQLLLIPTMLSSLIYPLIVLPRDNAASGIPNG
jgi:hypothetical protein